MDDLLSLANQKNQHNIYTSSLYIRVEMIREITKGNEKITVLKVPWYQQSQLEWTCFVCSLKMCMEYFKNVFEYRKGAEMIKNKIPDYSINEIIDFTNTRNGVGTTINENLSHKLVEKGYPFKFTIKRFSTLEEIKGKIDEYLPVIVMYDGSYLYREERGGGHSGVVIGFTKDGHLVLNNPWFGAEYIAERERFERAWELEYNTAFFMKPSLQKSLVGAEP